MTENTKQNPVPDFQSHRKDSTVNDVNDDDDEGKNGPEGIRATVEDYMETDIDGASSYECLGNFENPKSIESTPEKTDEVSIGDKTRPPPIEYSEDLMDDKVVLPCSTQTFLTKVDEDRNCRTRVPRWEVITRKLTNFVNKMRQLKFGFQNEKGRFLSEELINSIQAYNRHYDWCNFEVLHYACSSETFQEFELGVLLAGMAGCAMRLPNLIRDDIPLLERGRSSRVELTQAQIHSLLCNAFFCTFPRRPQKAQGPPYPDINFISLFHNQYQRSSDSKVEKLKCFLNYFKRMSERDGDGTKVIFQRRVLQDPLVWTNMLSPLSHVETKSSGSIEVDGKGMRQVDFANKLVGGGVLGNGAVMEEIRFSVCPELVAARIFTQELGDEEVLLVSGPEQFSRAAGYGHSFSFAGSWLDEARIGERNIRELEVVAMDALHFQADQVWEQFRPALVERELVKCLCAFQTTPDSAVSGVATGNWGCGVFNGDPELKALIQILAASACKQPLTYFTFGNEPQAEALRHVVTQLTLHNITCSGLHKLLTSYYLDNVSQCPDTGPETSLFAFILQSLEAEVQAESMHLEKSDPDTTDSTSL